MNDIEAARAALAEYEASPDRDPKIVADFHLRLDSADREEASRRAYARGRRTQERATAATIAYGDILGKAVEAIVAALERMEATAPAPASAPES